MLLFYSPNSPYARIARIAVRECGMMASVVEKVAANRQPDNPVLEHSPVGRVPTLVDDGLVITEAKNVFRYLAEKSGAGPVQATLATNWQETMQEGQILGYLDGISGWVRENRRDPEQRSSFLVQVETDRSRRCLAYFEQEAASGRLREFPWFRSIALATGLDLMTFQQLHPTWRGDFPDLSSWFELQRARPSMQATAPIQPRRSGTV